MSSSVQGSWLLGDIKGEKMNRVTKLLHSTYLYVYRQSQNQDQHSAELDNCISMNIMDSGEAASVGPRLRKQDSSSSIGTGARMLWLNVPSIWLVSNCKGIATGKSSLLRTWYSGVSSKHKSSMKSNEWLSPSSTILRSLRPILRKNFSPQHTQTKKPPPHSALSPKKVKSSESLQFPRIAFSISSFHYKLFTCYKTTTYFQNQCKGWELSMNWMVIDCSSR